MRVNDSTPSGSTWLSFIFIKRKEKKSKIQLWNIEINDLSNFRTKMKRLTIPACSITHASIHFPSWLLGALCAKISSISDCAAPFISPHDTTVDFRYSSFLRDKRPCEFIQEDASVKCMILKLSIFYFNWISHLKEENGKKDGNDPEISIWVLTAEKPTAQDTKSKVTKTFMMINSLPVSWMKFLLEWILNNDWWWTKNSWLLLYESRGNFENVRIMFELFDLHDR